MPQLAAKKRPPGGRRVSRIEMDRRLQVAEAMLRDGQSRREVVLELGRRFGASPRTSDEYITRVRSRWIEEGAEARKTERERAVARLRYISRKAEAKGAFAAAVNAE